MKNKIKSQMLIDSMSVSQHVGCNPFGKPLSPKNMYIMINKSSKITVTN